MFVALTIIINLLILFCLCLRLPQTQPQFGRQRDWAFAPVSGSRAALQRPIQHPEREARPACHQGQVQGPDWGGGGEQGPTLTAPHVIAAIKHQISPFTILRTVKATEYRNVPLFCSVLLLCLFEIILCCCVAGERALRIRVAKVSGKCSGGLYLFVSFV